LLPDSASELEKMKGSPLGLFMCSYIVTQNLSFLFFQFGGFAGALAGFLVAYRQLYPQQRISFCGAVTVESRVRFSLYAMWCMMGFFVVGVCLFLFLLCVFLFVFAFVVVLFWGFFGCFFLQTTSSISRLSSLGRWC
jgi:hypothetical protein